MLDRFKTLVSYGLYLLSVATLALLIGGSKRTLADTEMEIATPSNLMRVTEGENDTDIGITFRIPSTVSLAKDLEVGGYTGFYEVEVISLGEGDCLIIEPDEELELRQEGKEPIKAIVDQRETEFSEAKTVEGQIRVYEGERLSAGIWAGSFSFNITTMKNKAESDRDSNNKSFNDINTSESGVIVEVVESIEKVEIESIETESTEVENTEESIEIESVEVASSEDESTESEAVESTEILETETAENTEDLEELEIESAEVENIEETETESAEAEDLKEKELWES